MDDSHVHKSSKRVLSSGRVVVLSDGVRVILVAIIYGY
jgi:hypothetical protein